MFNHDFLNFITVTGGKFIYKIILNIDIATSCMYKPVSTALLYSLTQFIIFMFSLDKQTGKVYNERHWLVHVLIAWKHNSSS